jgi:hypothetical protein
MIFQSLIGFALILALVLFDFPILSSFRMHGHRHLITGHPRSPRRCR